MFLCKMLCSSAFRPCPPLKLLVIRNIAPFNIAQLLILLRKLIILKQKATNHLGVRSEKDSSVQKIEKFPSSVVQ
jgi:hypothetical protein